MVKRRTATQVKASLDRLARDICYLKTNRTCERCGSTVGVQWAHIESRRKKGQMIRWSENNCLALCAGPGSNSCHAWFDNNKIASSAWLQVAFPEKYHWIKEPVDGKPRSEHLFTEGIGALLLLEDELKERKRELKEEI